MAGVREQSTQRGGAVLEVVAVGDTEAHVARLRGDAELAEETLEVRVVAVVHDDEAGVHVMAAIRGIDAYGVGVAADPVGGLEHRNVMLTVEQMGRDEAGDPRADDGDSHDGTYTSRAAGRFSA